MVDLAVDPAHVTRISMMTTRSLDAAGCAFAGSRASPASIPCGATESWHPDRQADSFIALATAIFVTMSSMATARRWRSSAS